MLHFIQGATRLLVCTLVLGVSSAFGALYTFDLTAPGTISGPSLVVSSIEDVNVTVTLVGLQFGGNHPVVINSNGAGVGTSFPDINGGLGADEALIILPSGTSPFTVVSTTFGQVDGTDDATIFLDQAPAHTVIDLGTGPTASWTPNSTTFNTGIAFQAAGGDDDFTVTQIVLDIPGASVPEPTSWTLFGAGVAALAWFRRKHVS